MSSYGELIGAHLESMEIAGEIGGDSVNYLLIDEYIKETGMRRDQMCLGCITDRYRTEMANELSQAMKEKLDQGIQEAGRIYENPMVNP